MKNWFNTLNSALEAEGLLESWDSINFGSIGYGETFSYTFDNGTRYGHYVTIYRDESGRYEKPVHYDR